MELRDIMESNLKPLQIFLFVFLFPLLLLLIITFLFIYYFGDFSIVINSIIQLTHTDELQKRYLIKLFLIILLIWSVPALCATASWVSYKKIKPISYGAAVLIQFAIICIIFVINDVNVLKILKDELLNVIVMPFLLGINFYIFGLMIITFWLAKQIFDIKDRDIGIKISNNFNEKNIINSMTKIIFMIFIMYIVIEFFIGRYYILLSYVFLFKKINLQNIFEINIGIYLKIFIIYLIQILPVVITLLYIAYKRMTFINMVYFTRLSLVIHIIFTVILGCISTIIDGIKFQNYFGLNVVSFLISSLNNVVVRTMISSLSFWLTMKITRTEGHLQRKHQ